MSIGIFLGILLILAGIGVIIKIVFNVDLPVFKIFFALLFIYLGIKMLSGDFEVKNIKRGDNVIIFGEAHFNGLPKDNEYTVIFGQAKIDLTESDLPDRQGSIEVNTIFGNTHLLIDKNQPVKIKADAVFATSEMPDKRQKAFGTIHYTTSAYQKDSSFLYIEVNSIFGKTEVLEK